MRIIKKRKKWGGSRGGDIAIFILLVLIGLFMLFPIYLSVIQSIKPVEELFVFPPEALRSATHLAELRGHAEGCRLP